MLKKYMSTRKIGLGKSISQMFGEDKVKEEFLKEQVKDDSGINEIEVDKEKEIKIIKNDKKTTNEAINIKINLVQPNLNQPRKLFDDERINELADNIKKYGILQPILVKKENSLYKIIAGERRWRAAKIAGLETVPVIIKEYDERMAKEVALIENVQRENLNAIEEALAYQSLITEYGLTQEEVAKRVNKKRSTITNSIRLLKLSKDIVELVKKGELSEGHARALLAIEEENIREKIAKRIIEEHLSVRDIENIAKIEKMQLIKKEKNKNETDSFIKLKVILKDIEKKLKDKLKTKVRIIPKNENVGKIEIEYYDKEDLDRIYMMMK